MHNMKVSSNQNQFHKKQVSFKSKPLHYVNLKKFTNNVDDGFIKAVFSELNPSNSVDKEAIKEIRESWKDNSTAGDFCDYFICDSHIKHPSSFAIKNPTKYFCIELINKNPLGQRIIGVLKTFPDLKIPDYYYLSRIATKNEFRYGDSERSIKNIGEILLGESFNETKKRNFSGLTFTSLCDEFFETSFNNAGIDFKNRWGDFTIEKGELNKYLEYIQKKFNINFSQKIKKSIID